MANPSKHLAQWTHNRSFIAHIPPQYRDWIVTVTFYTALHAVDTLLEHDRVAGIVSHESRNTTLMKTNRYQAINRAYRPLYDLSRTVRYLANPATWVKQEDLQSRVFALLYDIEKSVIKLSNTAIELPALTLLS